MGNGNVKGKESNYPTIENYSEKSPTAKFAVESQNKNIQENIRTLQEKEVFPKPEEHRSNSNINMDSPTYGMPEEDEIDHTVIDEEELVNQQNQDFSSQKVIEPNVA